MKSESDILRDIANNPELLEVARLKIEDDLVQLRDARISTLRNNGLVIKEFDGTESTTIRLGSEDAIRIGLYAIAKALEAQNAP